MGYKGGGKGQYMYANPGKGKGDDGGKGKGGGKGSFGPQKGPTGKTIFYGPCHHCGTPGHSAAGCPHLGKGFKGNCNSCGLPGHTWDQCPKYPYGKGKGTKGGMNAVDSAEDHINLGGGEERSEPEGEKNSDESTENTMYAGMNKFSALAEDWSNEDYTTNSYGTFEQAGWGWGPPGFYALKKIEEGEHEKCGDNCDCGFIKKENKRDKKARIREEAHKNNKVPGEILAVGNSEESDWMEIDAIVDSGAIDTIAPKGAVEGLQIRQTEISKRKGKYASADGGVIQNLGECDMEGVAEDGTPMKLITQVGDKLVNMLISVRRMVESGNMVVFGANQQAIRKLAACDKIEKNMIVGRNGKKTEIKDENGMYVYKMKIKKMGKNDMDLGTINARKSNEASDNEIDDPF